MTIPPNLLEEERILIDAPLTTRSMVLEALAGLLEDSEISGDAIEAKFAEREELGSTGIGSRVTSTPANIRADSAMPGRRSSMTSEPRCSRCR